MPPTGITEEALRLKKYLELKEERKPTLRHLTAKNYGRPSEQPNLGEKRTSSKGDGTGSVVIRNM
jgi:hypothetical protein